MSNKKKSYFYILLFQLLGGVLMFLFKAEDEVTTKSLIAISSVLIVGFVNVWLNKRLIGYDLFYVLVSMLFSIGTLEIFRLNSEYGVKQMIWFLIGVAFMYVSYMIIKNTDFHEYFFYMFVGAIYILFLYTLLFGINRNGARNWVSIYGHLFQPVEIIKLLFIFQLATLENSSFTKIKYYKLINEAIAFSYFGLLFLQRDLGSALLLFIIYISYLYVFETERKYFAVTLILFSAFAVIGFLILPHVRVRFMVWTNPFKYFAKKGYQIVTALTAIANGGLFGTGIGLGIPNIIPVNISDMILAAIGEEMGTIMILNILIIYVIFFSYSLKLAKYVSNKYYKKLAVLIPVSIVSQFFVILMGTLNMIPLTGVTAPFISYGGSSMISSFMMLGVLQAALRKNV